MHPAVTTTHKRCSLLLRDRLIETPSAVQLSLGVHSARWVNPSPFVRTDVEGDGRM
jgi:hypothetical protein